MPIRLLIVDDHRVFGQGLAAVLDADPEFEPTAISQPDELISEVTARRPDVVIMDVRARGGQRDRPHQAADDGAGAAGRS